MIMFQNIFHKSISVAAFLLVLAMLTIQMHHLVQGDWVVLGAMCFYLMVGILFLIRKPSQEHSTKPMHWVAALGASWLPFLVDTSVHHDFMLVWLSIPIEICGLLLAYFALYSLGRGFGVIAARREVKTKGAYHFVRHPLYAAEAVMGFAVILQNPSLLNTCIYLIMMTCQILRIQEEERILSVDAVYVSYREEVPYRLFPGIY